MKTSFHTILLLILWHNKKITYITEKLGKLIADLLIMQDYEITKVITNLKRICQSKETSNVIV